MFYKFLKAFLEESKKTCKIIRTRPNAYFTKAKIYHYYSLPVKITANQQPLTDLVDKILRKKQSNPDFDTLAIETDLDKLIYQLYDLSVDEIRIIES